MAERMGRTSPAELPIVAREVELASVRRVVTGSSPHRAIVIGGEPGIGKTTLWEAGVLAAEQSGARILLARPSGAEAKLAYATLIDLLDGVATEELRALLPPQRRALEVALLRADPGEEPPDPAATAVGFLNALRALASESRLVVAVDDVQWLDQPSADVLTFAARRLEHEAISFVLAKRPAKPTPLERALERRGLEQLEVGALSLGATRLMLAVRLGLTVPRHVLRRVHESTLGNPLFVLELGRSLVARGQLELGEDIPVPETVEDLLGTNVSALSAPVRRLLLAVALSAELRPGQLAAVADEAAVSEGVDVGILIVDAGRLRASHPLLAAAASDQSSDDERRELHLALAAVVTDQELRAHHLALAARQPDDELAASVAAAAGAAAARGAVQDAARLSEHALRITPRDSPERTGRLFALASRLDLAGEPHRVAELLEPELPSLPPGPLLARAHALVSEGMETVPETLQHLRHALDGSEDEPALRALVLAKLSIITATTCVERIADAEAWALEALDNSSDSGADVERLALSALGWARVLRGRPIDDLGERFHAVSSVPFHIADSLDRVIGARLAWRGEVAEAEALLTRMIGVAEERDEPWSAGVLRMNLCDLAMRRGDFSTAARLLDAWAESTGGELLAGGAFYDRCRALLAAGLGDAEGAAGLAARSIEAARSDGERWSELAAQRALGVAALLVHDPQGATESLRAVWSHTRREGVEDPGAHPVAPDLVEALLQVGELDEARAVTAALREPAERQAHPWGLVTARRCAALVRLAEPRHDEEAAERLAEVASSYAELGLRFDRARSLLGLGRAQRRHRKWGAARASLEDAAAAFEELGSEGWAEATRSELGRVGARRPRPEGELTEAERRVVDLAVEGLSNKEIAAALVVTVPTVESHLSRAYAKLGIRSRAQLAARLAARPQS